MINNTITDIFFDLDHTLWDFEKNSALAFEKVLKKHEIQVDLDVFLEHYVPLNLKFNHLFDGTVEILDYLEAKYNLHIITNGFQEVQDGKMKNSGIDKYFKTITNSEMAGVKKPNPLIFEYALQKANAQKQNSIMIGDCLDADVNGALNFGMDAIHFNENNKEARSLVKQVTQLIELKNHL